MEIRLFLTLLLLTIVTHTIFSPEAYALRLYPEREYQVAWCSDKNGKSEVVLQDKTRVDCVVNNYAIEFDFANKWSEAVGQSLYYAHVLKKTPAIVLILENKNKDSKYLERLNKIAPAYGITVWTIEPDYLTVAR